MKTKHIVMIVLIVLIVILILQNSITVPVNFFFWPMAMPLFFLVLGVFAIGLVIGYLAAKVDRKKKPKTAVVPAGPEAKMASAPVTKPGPPVSSGPPPAAS